jgi:hypothetical protein
MERAARKASSEELSFRYSCEDRMIPAASVCSSQSLRRNVSARQYELANKWRILRLVSWFYVPP